MHNDILIPISELSVPDYVGSVQKLYYSDKKDDIMICETTSGGSVFDVGTIFNIKNSDNCRAAIRHKVFQLLKSAEEWRSVFDGMNNYSELDIDFIINLNKELITKLVSKGAATHHIGMIDENTGKIYEDSFPPTPSRFVVVKRYNILKPSRMELISNSLWDYSIYHEEDKYVIPLENIIRFGLTSGSSIYRKYLSLKESEKEFYLRELGLPGEMIPWTVFDRPVIDFTTKFEPDDRNLSLQEAFYISGQSGLKFAELISMSLYGSMLVSRFFNKMGLYLWDIKWEIALDKGQLVFVDTIDTDSVRVTARIPFKEKHFHIHYNKQAMRDYYKIIHADWYAAINETKKLAKKAGKSFLELLSEGQAGGKYPSTPEVDVEFIRIQERKFSTILAYLLEEISPNEAANDLSLLGTEEIGYYKRSPGFEHFCELNGI